MSQPGSNFLTIQNNYILSRAYTSSGSAGFLLNFQGGPIDTSWMILNNRFENGMGGVNFNAQSRRVHVLDNVFEGQSGVGVLAAGVTNLRIEGNYIHSDVTPSSMNGITISGGFDTVLVRKNFIDLAQMNQGLRLHSVVASGANRAIVANNYVIGEGVGPRGINLSASTSVDVLFNSVLIKSGNTTSTGFSNVGSASTDTRVANNIFSNTAGGLAVNLANNTGFTQFDYNVLHATGANLGRLIVTDYANLAAWQGATGNDANSIEADP